MEEKKLLERNLMTLACLIKTNLYLFLKLEDDQLIHFYFSEEINSEKAQMYI